MASEYIVGHMLYESGAATITFAIRIYEFAKYLQIILQNFCNNTRLNENHYYFCTFKCDIVIKGTDTIHTIVTIQDFVVTLDQFNIGFKKILKSPFGFKIIQKLPNHV